MILSVSTLAVVACQGCQGSTASQYITPLHSYEISAKTDDRASAPAAKASVPQASIAPTPAQQSQIISADSRFALTQSQTTTTGSISITPILGRDTLDADLDFSKGFTGTRLSSSNAVIDFEGARKSANLSSPVRSIREFDAALTLSANDAQTGLFNDGVDLAGQVPPRCVRLDDRKSALFGHCRRLSVLLDLFRCLSVGAAL